MTRIDYLNKIPGVSYFYSLSRTHGWSYVASWAHRITGVLLVLYLCFHINTLNALGNPEVFESKMKFFANMIPPFFEWMLALPVIYHSLNGGRLILYEVFENQRDELFARWALYLSFTYVLVLGILMYNGNQSVSATLFWGGAVVVSGYLTYWTMIKIKSTRASYFWKLQRITGIFLLSIIPAHMLFMHLDPTIGRDSQLIITRMNNQLVRIVDLILVVCCVYHAAYGLYSAACDYISPRRTRLISLAILICGAIIFVWTGVTLTLSI